jgi:replicative DNA helicase
MSVAGKGNFRRPKQESVEELFGKVPPQNLDAEKAVLGSILLDNVVIDDLVQIVKTNHFYSDKNARIFSAILRLHDAGVRGIDAVTVAEELDSKGELDEAGNVMYLHEVLESVPHAAHAEYYANIVRDKSVQRELIHSCTEIIRESYSPQGDTLEVLNKAEQSIFSILESQGEGDKIEIKDILMDAFDRIHERTQKEGTLTGTTTGFVDLDEQINGFQPSELIILAARPSMGKTALVCNFAEAAADEGNVATIIFSLEQSKLELAERLLCIRSGVNGHSLRAGDLEEDERHRLLEASSQISEMPLFIDDKPGRTIQEISAICRRLKRLSNLGLIIIDYLQLIEPEDKTMPREQQIAGITRRLKGLCKELNVPTIALAQLNRGVELREDKRPRLADLRESGAIEQDADLIMFLHRPDAYDPEDHPGLAEVVVAKHRSGPTGIVNLTWLRESMRFGNYTNLDVPEGGYMGEEGGGGGGFG